MKFPTDIQLFTKFENWNLLYNLIFNKKRNEKKKLSKILKLDE